MIYFIFILVFIYFIYLLEKKKIAQILILIIFIIIYLFNQKGNITNIINKKLNSVNLKKIDVNKKIKKNIEKKDYDYNIFKSDKNTGLKYKNHILLDPIFKDIEIFGNNYFKICTYDNRYGLFYKKENQIILKPIYRKIVYRNDNLILFDKHLLFYKHKIFYYIYAYLVIIVSIILSILMYLLINILINNVLYNNYYIKIKKKTKSILSILNFFLIINNNLILIIFIIILLPLFTLYIKNHGFLTFLLKIFVIIIFSLSITFIIHLFSFLLKENRSRYREIIKTYSSCVKNLPKLKNIYFIDIKYNVDGNKNLFLVKNFNSQWNIINQELKIIDNDYFFDEFINKEEDSFIMRKNYDYYYVFIKGSFPKVNKKIQGGIK